jgi:hypothetical protein
MPAAILESPSQSRNAANASYHLRPYRDRPRCQSEVWRIFMAETIGKEAGLRHILWQNVDESPEYRQI